MHRPLLENPTIIWIVMKWKKTLTKKKVFGGVFNAKWNQNHLIVRQYATQEESETGQERNTGERNTRRKSLSMGRRVFFRETG